jgi:hypothetical protein
MSAAFDIYIELLYIYNIIYVYIHNTRSFYHKYFFLLLLVSLFLLATHANLINEYFFIANSRSLCWRAHALLTRFEKI